MMGIILRGFFRCVCGKLHMYSGTAINSKCPNCKRDLNKAMGW